MRMEDIECRAHEDSFDNEVLREIEQQQERLQKKQVTLKLMGFYRKAENVQEKIIVLEKTKKSMKRLLGVHTWQM